MIDTLTAFSRGGLLGSWPVHMAGGGHSHHLHGIAAANGRTQVEDVKENGAQRVDIAPCIEGFDIAARLLSRGAYRIHFWGGVLLLGTLVPMLALVAAAAIDATAPSVLAAVLALAGLWLWEDLWVKAGQSIPRPHDARPRGALDTRDWERDESPERGAAASHGA